MAISFEHNHELSGFVNAGNMLSNWETICTKQGFLSL